ncbi:hypothetical protein PRIPAC_91178 [Pristionchus pacificus]|uniref:Uncharacterized protein n=1 Tax=Pristionchus pacificus TaxID=54126 RepID=A0A2A6B6A1_PRIPA|nr:hypothetical protein PRIPAC_91178 [Pristionchus pacificus]|eukprot:PDM61415.1 hypothetical protein PRIPAC_50857 [Pristionchus pacificus]
MTYSYNCLLVNDIGGGVFHVQLNRTKQLNALDQEIWDEIGNVFNKLDTDSNCRVVILSGNGRAFSTGIDLTSFSSSLAMDENLDVARRSRNMLRMIEKMQYSFTLIEKCSKPVIAAIHGYCLGGGIDITSACDIRYCSKETDFSVKEVAVGLAADVGSLNRLPHIIGNHSWLREVALTARHFGAKEALEQGYVSRVFETYDALIAAAKETAKTIATSSPVAVQGTKVVLNYARDHTVDDSLRYVAMWNMSQLQTDDIAESAVAVMTKGPKPNYSKL